MNLLRRGWDMKSLDTAKTCSLFAWVWERVLAILSRGSPLNKTLNCAALSAWKLTNGSVVYAPSRAVTWSHHKMTLLYVAKIKYYKFLSIKSAFYVLYVMLIKLLFYEINCKIIIDFAKFNLLLLNVAQLYRMLV